MSASGEGPIGRIRPLFQFENELLVQKQEALDQDRFKVTKSNGGFIVLDTKSNTRISAPSGIEEVRAIETAVGAVDALLTISEKPEAKGEVHKATGTLVYDNPEKLPKDLTRFAKFTLENPTADLATQLIMLGQLIAISPMTEVAKLGLRAYILSRTTKPEFVTFAYTL